MSVLDSLPLLVHRTAAKDIGHYVRRKCRRKPEHMFAAKAFRTPLKFRAKLLRFYPPPYMMNANT
ncbi:MAG: hypothetical protein ABI178_03100 [Rhodanobacter sp.]